MQAYQLFSLNDRAAVVSGYFAIMLIFNVFDL